MTPQVHGAVLFDLDGTLVDTTDLILQSFLHTFEVHLPGRAPTRADLIATFGRSLPATLEEFAALSDTVDARALADAMLATYRDHQRVHHDLLIRPFPGVRPMLEELKRERWRLGLVTSKMESVARKGMRLFDLEGFFETGVFHDDTTRHKPLPEPLWLASERLGVPPADVIYIGDSIHDVAAGRAAGMRTVAALWGPFDTNDLQAAGPDATAASPREVPAILRALRARTGGQSAGQ
jgi:pyrophosphatase PpaX